MLQKLTKIKVKDNSGLKSIKCIQICKKKKAIIGNFIISVVQNFKKSNLKIQKKNIFKALIINTKKECSYKDFCFFKFDFNQAVLLTEKNTLIGTRIFGILTKNLRKKKMIKILTQALYLI
jgi:large subunit ribosomal protein L14